MQVDNSLKLLTPSLFLKILNCEWQRFSFDNHTFVDPSLLHLKCLCFILLCDFRTLPNLKMSWHNSHPAFLWMPKICNYAEESCAYRKEIIFFISLEIKPSFGPVEKGFVYHELTTGHQECNRATNCLIVFYDFPLWPAALTCQGGISVVFEVLFKSNSTVNCRGLCCCLLERE